MAEPTGNNPINLAINNIKSFDTACETKKYIKVDLKKDSIDYVDNKNERSTLKDVNTFFEKHKEEISKDSELANKASSILSNAKVRVVNRQSTSLLDRIIQFIFTIIILITLNTRDKILNKTQLIITSIKQDSNTNLEEIEKNLDNTVNNKNMSKNEKLSNFSHLLNQAYKEKNYALYIILYRKLQTIKGYEKLQVNYDFPFLNKLLDLTNGWDVSSDILRNIKKTYGSDHDPLLIYVDPSNQENIDLFLKFTEKGYQISFKDLDTKDKSKYIKIMKQIVNEGEISKLIHDTLNTTKMTNNNLKDLINNDIVKSTQSKDIEDGVLKQFSIDAARGVEFILSDKSNNKSIDSESLIQNLKVNDEIPASNVKLCINKKTKAIESMLAVEKDKKWIYPLQYCCTQKNSSTFVFPLTSSINGVISDMSYRLKQPDDIVVKADIIRDEKTNEITEIQFKYDFALDCYYQRNFAFKNALIGSASFSLKLNINNEPYVENLSLTVE